MSVAERLEGARSAHRLGAVKPEAAGEDASCARAARSSSASARQLQSSVARSVCCRAGRSGATAARSRARRAAPPAPPAGAASCVRPRARSPAAARRDGRRPRRCWARWRRSIWNAASTARARCAKSRTASLPPALEGRIRRRDRQRRDRYSCSAVSRSGARLVARMAEPGARESRVPTSGAAGAAAPGCRARAAFAGRSRSPRAPVDRLAAPRSPTLRRSSGRGAGSPRPAPGRRTRAIAELSGHLLGDGEREPRLPGAARSGQRDEPRALAHERGHGGHFEASADERGRRCGQRDRAARSGGRRSGSWRRTPLRAPGAPGLGRRRAPR